MIKYIKSVLWRVAKRLSYIQNARCLKVNIKLELNFVKRKPVQYIQACVFGHGDCRTNWENIFDAVFNVANILDNGVRGGIDTNLNWIKRIVLAY